MAILIYDYYELQDRSSKHLKAWKAWHTILFILAVVAGILNYVFIQNAMDLVDDNCILYPRQLEFHMAELSHYDEITTNNEIETNSEAVAVTEGVTVKSIGIVNGSSDDPTMRARRELVEPNGPLEDDDEIVVGNNGTILVGNDTHRLMLDVRRSLYGGGCDYARYMPLMATVFALVWTVLFIMCPGGGRVRSGLQQPWRILMPALLFALLMVALTGYGFAATNGGVKAFCAGFQNITNTTACSSTSPYIALSWNASWAMGQRLNATRASAGALWAAWACVAAILLARCITAPDFMVQRRGVYLAKDPDNKLAPYLVPRSRSVRSSGSSRSRRETSSLKSDPTTVTTEVPTTSRECTKTTEESLTPRKSDVEVHELKNDIEMSEKLDQNP